MTSQADLTEGVGIQQFCHLAKNAKGKTCTLLIGQAMSAPTVFVFGELIDNPNVQQLQGTEEQKWLDLLKIFAYGTYGEYKANASSLPELTATQSRKLKQLTLVALSNQSKLIPYDVLSKELDIGNVRELEDLIIDSIYLGIIQGSLDQKNKHLEVESAMGRDIKPDSVDNMIAILTAWSSQSDTLLRTIKEKINHAAMIYESEKTHKEEFDKRVEALKVSIKEESMHGGGEFDEFYGDERNRKGRNQKPKGMHGMSGMIGSFIGKR
eukprot:TRINITY_DN21932_c1_g1_i1.p1 TRINITY_DN21932_c1_g1~~TRINITY_DN21932_c1_g1_i1.p1  ORF type:complete len:267 (+),score=64.45 TRINITY_DN21932_c1_g1_i1:51-851(+)